MTACRCSTTRCPRSFSKRSRRWGSGRGRRSTSRGARSARGGGRRADGLHAQSHSFLTRRDPQRHDPWSCVPACLIMARPERRASRMEYTEFQKAEFREAYAARRTRQIVFIVAFIVLMVPLAIAADRVKGLSVLLIV